LNPFTGAPGSRVTQNQGVHWAGLIGPIWPELAGTGILNRGITPGLELSRQARNTPERRTKIWQQGCASPGSFGKWARNTGFHGGSQERGPLKRSLFPRKSQIPSKRALGGHCAPRTFAPGEKLTRD